MISYRIHESKGEDDLNAGVTAESYVIITSVYAGESVGSLGEFQIRFPDASADDTQKVERAFSIRPNLQLKVITRT